MIEFYLDWMPSINNYYVKTKNGVFISGKGRQARQSGIEMIQSQLGQLDLIDEPVNLVIVLFPPNKRRFDLDNRVKCIQDTITHAGVWADDNLVFQLSVYMGEIVPDGAILVRIREAGPVVRRKFIDEESF